MKKTSAKTDVESAARNDAGQQALERYRQKRNPAHTNEPFSAERPARSDETHSGRFVVHLHAAARTHYDLRLQVGGTLKSFAVPRGPSLNPDDKRLAVNTEDHPLEYLEFEEVIPDGNYGAGAMIAWDLGRVRYLDGSAEAGLLRGKLDFELSGFKLCGRFALVHTGKRKAHADPASAHEWLLFKKPDGFSSKDGDVLVQQPESVFSGLTVEELARKAEISRELSDYARDLGARRGSCDARDLCPMLCAAARVDLDDPEWLYELKLDGVRIVADKQGDAVLLRYRNGRAASLVYPEIVRAVRALAPERVVLDGEIVALDDQGKPSFQRLATRIHAARPFDVLRARAEVPVRYVLFDVIALGAHDLRDVCLERRKAVLGKIVKGRGLLRTLDAVPGRGQDLLEFCKEQGLEGVVAKRARSLYVAGPRRTRDWVKIKCEREHDFVVVGWVTGKGARKPLGALDVASYAQGRLIVRGKVGTGLDDRSIDVLLGLLEPLELEAPAAAGEFTRDTGVRRYVRPKLVVRVRHMGFTDDGKLRHPIFCGLRHDVEPEACTGESSEDVLETIEAETAKVSAPHTVDDSAPVPISNPDKVFWPEEGYTKRDLCAYYASVAPVMLPFLKGRPIVVVRYPDGIRGKHFYQWRAPDGTPPWIRTLELRDEDELLRGDSKSVFLIDDTAGLVHLANLGCIPIHVLAATERSLDECNFLTIDLDIGEQPFKSAVVLALSLRELLGEIGLAGFPKTSGQKGLHVLIPLPAGVSFEAAKLLVELLGRLLVLRHERLATMERRVNKRGPRVYVDTGQTGRSRTIVAPYSVRAHPGATVSTPLAWDEVHVGLDPLKFAIATIPGRLADLGDPMAGMLDRAPDVTEALRRLEQKFRRA